MKNLIPALLLAVASYCFAQTQTVKTWYDPYAKTQVHEIYITLNGLKHGLYKEFDEKGYLLKEWNYSNGQLNGISKSYFGVGLAAAYNNPKCYLGKLFTQSTYVNDEPQGVEVMYDYESCVQKKLKEVTWANGMQAKVVSYFGNGNKQEELLSNGTCQTFFENGKIKTKYTMLNGKPHGAYVEYFPSGKVYSKSKYKDGNLIDTLYYYFENGKLQERSINDGTSNIAKKSEVFATNGNLKLAKIKIDDQKAEVTEYDSISKVIETKYNEKFSNSERKLLKVGRQEFYENGKLRASKYFENGVEDGPFTIYDINGDTVVKGNVVNGKYHGQWILTYDEQWNHPYLMDSITYFRIIEFSYGSIIGTTRDYYADRTPQWEGKLIGIYPDVIDGFSTYYHPNGKKAAEGKHDRGKKVGEWKYYDENGNLTVPDRN